jgi:predicted metal-dependent RNase
MEAKPSTTYEYLNVELRSDLQRPEPFLSSSFVQVNSQEEKEILQSPGSAIVLATSA